MNGKELAKKSGVSDDFQQQSAMLIQLQRELSVWHVARRRRQNLLRLGVVTLAFAGLASLIWFMQSGKTPDWTANSSSVIPKETESNHFHAANDPKLPLLSRQSSDDRIFDQARIRDYEYQVVRVEKLDDEKFLDALAEAGHPSFFAIVNGKKQLFRE